MDPLYFENNQNTLIQTANPGIGANPSQYGYNESIVYYDADGELWLGPGQRFDLSIECRSPINLWIDHARIRFQGPALSDSRPHQMLRWTPKRASPSFVVSPHTSGGGRLCMTTGLNFGDGLLEADYLGAFPHNGMAAYFVFATEAWSYQVIECGWRHDDNNKIYLSRADYLQVGTWIAHCVNNGNGTSLSSGMPGTGARVVFCVAIDATDNARFFIGNWNNTMVEVASISTNINKGVMMLPYIRHSNHAYETNRNLWVSHIHVVRNS